MNNLTLINFILGLFFCGMIVMAAMLANSHGWIALAIACAAFYIPLKLEATESE